MKDLARQVLDARQATVEAISRMQVRGAEGFRIGNDLYVRQHDIEQPERRRI